MTGPGEEFQDMLINTMLADPVLSAELGAQVFDVIPGGVQPPYASVESADMRPNGADGMPGRADHTRQIDIWTRKGGKAACIRLCERVVKLFHLQRIELTENKLQGMTAAYRVTPDPDNITMHGIVSVSGIIEEP